MNQTCRLYNINGAADQMGQHHSFVRRLIRKGVLKPVAGLRRLMISEVELQRFLTTTEPYVPRHRPGKKLGVAE
jgi:Helix-turn-helix domain